MKVSAISQISADEAPRRNFFIRYSNSFMSSPQIEKPAEKALNSNPKNSKMGIETLESFTIFPKEVVNGRTVITA